jgi:hypothetical protein
MGYEKRKAWPTWQATCLHFCKKNMLTDAIHMPTDKQYEVVQVHILGVYQAIIEPTGDTSILSARFPGVPGASGTYNCHLRSRGLLGQ